MMLSIILLCPSVAMSELVINKRKSDKASIQSRESVHISYSITLHCIADKSLPKDSASHKKKIVIYLKTNRIIIR